MKKVKKKLFGKGKIRKNSALLVAKKKVFAAMDGQAAKGIPWSNKSRGSSGRQVFGKKRNCARISSKRRCS